MCLLIVVIALLAAGSTQAKTRDPLAVLGTPTWHRDSHGRPSYIWYERILGHRAICTVWLYKAGVVQRCAWLPPTPKARTKKQTGPPA